MAREVGVEGKLGGQASVPNVSGTWKDLTDNVNQMASNLTDQVREIARVTTAVADGDLSGKITEEGKGGEVLGLTTTINRMVDSLNIFAAEVTNVAREVGVEGKLGGQADVPDVAGTWKGPYRECKYDGIQPDCPGTGDCGSGNVGCEWGSFQKNYN